MYLLLQIRAALRLLTLVLLMGIGLLCVVLLSLFPGRVEGARLATWPVLWMARAFMWLFGIRYTCSQPDLVRQHHGLIFCNHTSFIDTLMILYLTPARFLSTKGVRKIPVIGQVAVALDTIFVHRFNDEARVAARQEIADRLQERTYPPLVLFPEGKIGPGDTVFPFRYGAFEIAQSEQVAVLPCALVYEPLAVLSWFKRQDNLIAMAWQVAIQRKPVQATLVPLEVVQIQPDDDIPQVAERMREAIEVAIGKSVVQEAVDQSASVPVEPPS